MTREQAKAKLVSFGIAEPTEEQITELLNSIQAETKSANDKANKYKTDAEKAADLQRQLDELNEKDMSEAEKANKALEVAQKQIAELTATSFKSEAKAILKGAGVADEDMEALLPGLIADTLENTQARANALVKVISGNIDSAIKAHDKELLNNTDTPDGNSGGNHNEEKKTEAELTAETIGKNIGESAKTANSILSQYTGGNSNEV